MLILKSVHQAHVKELERCITTLETGVATLLKKKEAMEGARDTLIEHDRRCLAILQSINTHRTGGEPLRKQIGDVVQQAKTLGILDAETEGGTPCR